MDHVDFCSARVHHVLCPHHYELGAEALDDSAFELWSFKNVMREEARTHNAPPHFLQKLQNAYDDKVARLQAGLQYQQPYITFQPVQCFFRPINHPKVFPKSDRSLCPPSTIRDLSLLLLRPRD